MLFWYIWNEHFNKQVELQTNVSASKHKHTWNVYTYVLQKIVRNCMIEIEPHSEEQ